MNENLLQNLTEIIGNTALLEVEKNIFSKLEFQNPGGSVKDRAALVMIQQAENAGELRSGDLIVEATSGNIGISLAWIGIARGYRVKLVMPESMSVERRKLIQQFGAELILTSAAGGMPVAAEKAKEIVETEGGWMPNQFENPANPEIHFQTTGPEIWKQMNGEVDFFVAGVGSGGTVSGVGKFLKSQNSQVKIIAIEPVESAVISGGEKGAHAIQGIGAGFVPKNFERGVVDEVRKVSSQTAIEAAKELANKKGISVGISSGANFAIAREIAKENPNKKIATVFCDGGERYLSTDLFANLD